MTINLESFRYPFETEIAHESDGAKIAHRNAFQGILDLNQALAAMKGQLTTTNATITKLAGSISTATETVTPSANSIGFINSQVGVTTYTTQQSDYGSLIVLNDASPIAVTLNTILFTPWFTTIVNQGTGLATLTPSSGTINGLASLALPPSGFTSVYFDGTNFTTSVPPVIFTRGGTILYPPGAINIIVWYAPFNATVTNVLGYVAGATGSVINAQRNGSLPLLVSNLTLGTAGTWIDGGAVQNTAISQGDKIEMMIVSASGSPTEIAVEIQCTRP